MDAKTIQAQIDDFIKTVLEACKRWALGENDALSRFFSHLESFFQLLSEFETSIA